MDPAPLLRMVRRRSFAGDGRVRALEERDDEPGCQWSLRRVQELEAAVARLQAEKEALRAELEFERSASATATSEVLLMIARLQREKAAAMIEGGVCELRDQFAAVCAIAASYRALLRAHGIDPEQDDPHREEDSVVVVVNKEPPPAEEEFEDKYAVEVRCAAVPVPEEDLCARVEALEADSAAVRREVEALRGERAHVVLARRQSRDDAAEKQQRRFPVLGIFKCFFSTISWGMKGSASAARKLPNIFASPTTYFLLGLLPLLERSKGTLQIQSKTRCQPVHSQEQHYSTLCYFFH